LNRLLLGFILLAGSAFAAAAEPWFSIQAGAEFSASRLNLEANVRRSESPPAAGVLLGAQAMFPWSERWAGGVEVNYFGHGTRFSDEILPGHFMAWAAKSTVFLAVARCRLAAGRTVLPYISAGAGAHRTNLVVDDDYVTIVNGHKWQPAAMLGAGVEFPLNEWFFFEFEGRFQYLRPVRLPVRAETLSWTPVEQTRLHPSMAGLLVRTGVRFR
jgi:opacity protein-like surface antigen